MTTQSEGAHHALNEELSKRVQAAVKPGSCWRNAFTALALADLAGAEYVEGWVVTKGSRQIIEHGWLENDGEVVDPTLPGEVEAYFAGLRFTAAQAREAFEQAKGKLPVAWYLAYDLGDKDAYAAYHEALERAQTAAGWTSAESR